MSKELKFEFNDYIIAIDEPYENDCGYVTIGKKDTKGNIDIWFKSLNEQTIDFYIELQKHIADLEAKLALTEKAFELACERLKNLYCSDYCGNLCDDWCVTEEDLKQECKLYYKCWNKDCILEQAKEMVKSE